MSNHYRHFKHLHIPDGWEQYWSKYPNGYTLMEALINWVGQVNDMVEVSNEVSDQITCLQRNFNALDKELRASWAGYKDSTTKQYEDFRDEVYTIINNWIASIEPTIQNKVVESLQLWLSDGTLADIINNDVFDMKANQTDFQTHTQEFDSFKAQTTTDLSNLDAQLQADILNMGNLKATKLRGLAFISDYPKLEGETDSSHINRILSLPSLDEATLLLEKKEYVLDDTIVLRRYQTLRGVGRGTVLKLETGTKDILTVEVDPVYEFTYGVTIENLSLQGSNQNTGVNLKKSSHVHMVNVYIYETKIGVLGESVWLAHYDRVTVRNFNQMGDYGFKIDGGTSNLYSNTWAKNVKIGYHSASLYTTFNATACDTFTDYAYWAAQTATFNSAGAEDAQLIVGGFVYGVGARGATFNSCETMSIGYEGTPGGASIFYFNGTFATINSYRNHGSYMSPNIDFMVLKGLAQITEQGTYFSSGYNNMYNFQSTSAVVLVRTIRNIRSHKQSGVTELLSL